MSLPGLDLQTLKKKNAAIGEWPEASEADLTPFMKVMISRTERGRALIKTVDSLNLMELAKASDSQIRAVTNLVWEIKGVFYALITGKASDVLGDLGGPADVAMKHGEDIRTDTRKAPRIARRAPGTTPEGRRSCGQAVSMALSIAWRVNNAATATPMKSHSVWLSKLNLLRRSSNEDIYTV